MELTRFKGSTGELTGQEWLEKVSELLCLKFSFRKIYIIGNGASSAMASHMAADLTKNAHRCAHTLTDPALLTCFSNDYSYETALDEMLRRYLRSNDVLIAISSSGKSPNILSALQAAKAIGCTTVGVSGMGADNPLFHRADFGLWVNSKEYGIIESVHALYLHAITDAVIEYENN